MLNKFEDFINKDIVSDLETLRKELINLYNISLDINLYVNNTVIILSRIIVPKEKRNEGIGTKVMKSICTFADKNNLRIALTPSSDFGGNKSKLLKFYKGFSFINYKGYEFRESLVREPQKYIK